MAEHRRWELFGGKRFLFFILGAMERRVNMAQISVNDLTFCYEGSFDSIFENVSFSIDTDW